MNSEWQCKSGFLGERPSADGKNGGATTSNVFWHQAVVQRENREAQNGHRSGVIWLTGLSGAGKSTLAHRVEEQLHQVGIRTYVLDGDNVRHALCGDLGFSASAREENIRRAGEVAKLFVDAGIVVLSAFISPYRADRERVRYMMMDGDFLEVYCRCTLDVCECRDPKGLYRRARAGVLEQFTGISSPYEEPLAPELVVDTTKPLDQCVKEVMALLRERGFLRGKFLT